MMSGPNVNLLNAVYIEVGEVLPAVYVFIYGISGGSRTVPYREVSEHRVLLSLAFLVSLDSFCVYDDLCLYLGTSEAIKVIWRQAVSN